jgi:hypothetical protein
MRDVLGFFELFSEKAKTPWPHRQQQHSQKRIRDM